MRGPTSLKLSSLLCEKEPMQQGSRHQRRRRSKTSWSSISTCDGSAMRSNTSWSSLSTCDGLSDSSRCSEADSENDHLSVLAVLSIRPPPGLPVPLEWIEFARALKAQQGIPQQVQCSVHVEPAPVVGAGKQKPFKKHHFVTYFTLYDPEKHQAFELISRIIGKKTDPKGSDNMKTDPKGSDNMKTDPKGSDNMKTDPKGSDNMKTDPKGSDNMKTDPKASQKGSDNMKAIFNQGKGIRIHVQGRGVKRAQIGWPHGYEVEELHIYCACPSEELKVKAIAKLCEILDPLSNHFHFFRRKLGGEKIEYNRSEPFYIIVEAPELRG